MQVIVYKVKSHVHANIGFEGVGIWSSNEYQTGGHTKAFRSPFCEQMLFTTFPTMVSQKKLLTKFSSFNSLWEYVALMIPTTGFLLYFNPDSSLVSSRDTILHTGLLSLLSILRLQTTDTPLEPTGMAWMYTSPMC
jgi:hypothetical protein